jgi:flavin reductase (DIM6/NTAB) family NADH-FMN oxidoreductase RutF
MLLTTRGEFGPNVMTMSWHMMVELNPPLIACIVSSGDFSFTALRSTRECTIAIPAVELAGKVVIVGNCSGRDVEKFAAFGSTLLPARTATAPLIAECFANLECRVTDAGMVDRYNLFVLEVTKAWIDPKQTDPKTIHHCGYGSFAVDGKIIQIESRMP